MQSTFVTVFGNVRDAEFFQTTCVHVRHVFPFKLDSSRRDAAQTGQSFDQLSLTVPLDSGDPDDLASANREAHLCSPHEPAHRLRR